LFTAERVNRAHAALAALLGLNGLRVSEACDTNIEDLAVDLGQRTLRIVGKGNTPATIPLIPRTGRTVDLAVGEPHHGPILTRADGQRLDRRTAQRWLERQESRDRRRPPAHASCRAHHGRPRRRCPLCDVQLAARPADPRTTTIYDRRRENFDRHAAYVVVAFVAGA
jgi:integrase/recombinase XerD